jgi:hypothetical protein
MLCILCKLRNGKPERNKGKTVVLCDDCSAKLALEAQYETFLTRMVACLKDKQFDAALLILEEAEQALSPFDRDNWLRSTILADRSIVYEAQGDLKKASDALEGQVELGFNAHWVEASTCLALARNLRALSDVDRSQMYVSRALGALNSCPPGHVLAQLQPYLELITDAMLEVHSELLIHALAAHGLLAPADLRPTQIVRWAVQQPSRRTGNKA